MYKTLKLGNATRHYGFNKDTVKSRIKEIDIALNNRVRRDKLWDEIMNGMDKIKNDKKSQIEFIVSCFNAQMTFSQILFMMNKFQLPKSILKEAICESQVKYVNEEKSNESSSINPQLQQLERSVWNTMKWCFQAMNQINNSDGDSTKWKHKVLDELLHNYNHTNDTAKSQNSKVSETVRVSPMTDENSYTTIPSEWQNDSKKLRGLCNGDDGDLDLNKYFEILKSIQAQEKRIKNQLYTNIAQINKELYKNQVCIRTFDQMLYHFILCI